MPRPDRSRAALIATAATLFRRQGYAGTGLNQILEEAGVKAGSMYHHFPGGKQELAAAVVEAAAGDTEQLLRRALARDVPVQTVIGRWVDALADGLAADGRDGCPVEPIATESVHASELVRRASARAFNGWCRVLEGRLRADGWPGPEAEAVSISIISLIEGALILSRTTADPTPLNAAKRSATSLLAR